jgi:butyrate kinase
MVDAATAVETTESPARELGTPIAHRFCKDGRRATVLEVAPDKFVVTVGSVREQRTFPIDETVVDWETAAQVCSRESAMVAVDLIAA